MRDFRGLGFVIELMVTEGRGREWEGPRNESFKKLKAIRFTHRERVMQVVAGSLWDGR